ncbi:MAG: hypothetical protein JW940_36365 [Polyangiaceae bacterium]|nr:hypothetical protein [Polyangiaceae bacterium]
MIGAGGASGTGAGGTPEGSSDDGDSAEGGTSNATGGRRDTRGSAGQGGSDLGSEGVSGAGTEEGADGTGNAEGGGAGPAGGAGGVPSAGGASNGGASDERGGSSRGMVAQAGAGGLGRGTAAGAGGAASTCIPARTVGGATSIICGFDSATGPNQVSELFLTDPDGLDDRELATSATLEAGTGPSVSFDPEVGDPTGGSLRIDIPFTAYNQIVEYQFHFHSYVDLSGRTLSLRVMVDPGGFVPTDDAPGGITLFSKTGTDWNWGASGWMNLTPSDYGRWLDVEFNMECPDGTKPNWNPKLTKAIGFQIGTGEPITASLPPLPTTAVVHIDTIGYRDNE